MSRYYREMGDGKGMDEEMFSRNKREDETEEEFEWNALGETLAMAVKDLYDDGCTECENQADCVIEPNCFVMISLFRGVEDETGKWVWNINAALCDSSVGDEEWEESN